MQTIYVTSENKQEGKTSFTTTLAHYLLTQGLNTAILNPLCNKDEESIYQKLLSENEDKYSANYTIVTNSKLEIDNIKKTYNSFSKNKIDILLIDGNNSISKDNINLIVTNLNAKIIFLAKYNSKLNEKNFDKWNKDFNENIFFIINKTNKFATHHVETELMPKLKSKNFSCFGYIPENKILLGTTPDEIAKFIEGEIINEYDDQNLLVENFLIGGMGMDPAEYHFNQYENKCVIVRGDRPDIQMSALNSNCSCLILTNNIKPIEYIQNEADLEKIPIMIVKENTVDTIEKLNGLHQNTLFDHNLKLNRYLELLKSNVKLNSLFSNNN